jgi:hypothetical protein
MRAALLLVLKLALARGQLVLGTESEVAITVTATPGRVVHLAASVGRVDPARAAVGSGTLAARFYAPSDRYPQVAVIAAWDDQGEAAMAVLRLYGSAVLPVSVDAPHAQVTVTIGAQSFSGTADATGHAELRVTAPPGERTGSVRAVDRLGNRKVTEVPLGIPDAPRMLLVVDPEAPLLADGRAHARAYAFAATPAGAPDPSLALSGKLAALHVVAPGVIAAELPARLALESIELRARASAQEVSRRVDFVAGPPSDIAARARPSPRDGEIEIVARVVDAAAHALALTPQASSASGVVGGFEPQPSGDYVARFRPAQPDDRSWVELSVGELRRSLVIEPARRLLRLELRAGFDSNLDSLVGAGVELWGWLLAGRRFLVGASLGAVATTGSLPVADGPPLECSLLGIPLRLALAVEGGGADWRPYAAVRGGGRLAFARLGAPGLADRDQREWAVEVGGELGLRRRFASGAFVVAVGYDYAPIVVGDTVTGPIAGLAVTAGWQLGR